MDPGDDELLLATAAGDREAFRHLMLRHSPPVLSLAQRILANAADADEVVQEVFLKVWVAAPKWQPDGAAKFSTWLYRVALNHCLDRRRRRVAKAALQEAEATPDPTPGGLERAIGGQHATLVAAALAELPHRQRLALSLYYFGEVSGPEAARILDMSLTALESLLLRGRRALLKALRRRGIAGLGDLI